MTTQSLRFLISAKDTTGPAAASAGRNLKSLQINAASVRTTLVGLAPALAGAFSVAGIAAFIKGTNDGVAKLKELRDATGASIENLSALEDIATRTGTSMDTAGKAVIKVNQALNAAKPGSNQALALEAIGLSAEKLRALDPAEALRQIAVAMEGFAETGEKARAAQFLFGEEIRIIAPLLKNLGTQGEFVAKVTTEQALAAEKFNNQLASLSKSATDVARQIAGPIVESLNQFFDAVTGKGVGGASAISDSVVVPMQALARAGANVAFVFRGVGIEIGGIAAQAAALARGDFAGARTIGKLMQEDAEEARREFDALERRLMSIGRVLPQATYSNEGRGQKRTSLLGLLGSETKTVNSGRAPKIEVPKIDGDMRAQVDAWEALRKALVSEGAATFQATRLPLERLNIELARQQRLLDELGPSYRDTYERAVFAAQEAADAALAVPEAVAEATATNLETINVFAEQASRNIQDALGDSIKAALEGDFKSISDLWANMLKRMVAEALAAQVTKALFGAGVGSGGGYFGAFLSALGSPVPRAAGGPVAAGRPYLVGERGPEIVVPRSSGTVLPNGQGLGGQQIHYSATFNVNGDVSPQTIAAIRAEVQRDRARWLRTMQAQGAL